MPRLLALLECVGQALCEKGHKALRRQWPFADLLQEIARAAFENIHRKLPGDDLRQALADAAACPCHEYDRRLGELIADLSQTHSVPKEALADYLRAFPPTVRFVFRRPSDPEGVTAPEKLSFYKAEEFLQFLPPRCPRFKPGDQPPGLDGWTLIELRGLGECSEVWRGEDPRREDGDTTAALKFAIDPETRDLVKGGTQVFQKIFGLNQVTGILPLQSVYLESDPPCLESPFVYGYDLTGLMFDWKWRYDAAKPEAALKLIRRLAGIVAEAHAKGVVHRDLKPSNVILHPTEGGKFTMWVTDFGWGQMVAPRSLELAKLGARGELQRLANRGAATMLYASPQQAKKEPPTQPDDVHALGVIWYQLLKRDPTAAAPVGTEWIDEFRPHGFTDSQARLLQACLATRPDKRPRTAAHMLEQLGQVTIGAARESEGSKSFAIKNPSSPSQTPVNATARGKAFDAEAAAAQAAAMLAAAGGGPLTSGGPLSTSGYRLVKNSIGMTFARVPAGTFIMGSSDKEHGHRQHEGPPHEIKISRPFYLAVAPVTQAQYLLVMGKNPAKFNKSHGGGNDHPVETVHWKEAESFCNRLAQLSEEEVHNRSYRLPTEAEWEYACRSGAKTAFHTGEKLVPGAGIFEGSGGKFGGKSTAPAGSTPPNAFGITDMHGNVQEWVNDWYEEYYYFESPAVDPPGPARGVLKVARGGCWGMAPGDCRSAARRPYPPDTHSDTIGFRVIMVIT